MALPPPFALIAELGILPYPTFIRFMAPNPCPRFVCLLSYPHLLVSSTRCASFRFLVISYHFVKKRPFDRSKETPFGKFVVVE